MRYGSLCGPLNEGNDLEGWNGAHVGNRQWPSRQFWGRAIQAGKDMPLVITHLQERSANGLAMSNMSVEGSVPWPRHEWGVNGAEHTFFGTVISGRAGDGAVVSDLKGPN